MAAGRDSGFSQVRHQDKRDGGASCSGAPVSRMHENRPDRALNRKNLHQNPDFATGAVPACARSLPHGAGAAPACARSGPQRLRHALVRNHTASDRRRHTSAQCRTATGMRLFGALERRAARTRCGHPPIPIERRAARHEPHPTAHGAFRPARPDARPKGHRTR